MFWGILLMCWWDKGIVSMLGALGIGQSILAGLSLRQVLFKIINLILKWKLIIFLKRGKMKFIE
jgi:hypothetical protein